MNSDPIEQFKARQRGTWTMGNFGDMAVFTTAVAGHPVRHEYLLTHGHGLIV